MIRLALALALLAAGCTTMTDTPPDRSVPAPAPGGRCDAAPAQGLVGKRVSDALIETARRSSGAATARALRPGAMVTMEYRADRLNLIVDAREMVMAIRCG